MCHTPTHNTAVTILGPCTSLDYPKASGLPAKKPVNDFPAMKLDYRLVPRHFRSSQPTRQERRPAERQVFTYRSEDAWSLFYWEISYTDIQYRGTTIINYINFKVCDVITLQWPNCSGSLDNCRWNYHQKWHDYYLVLNQLTLRHFVYDPFYDCWNNFWLVKFRCRATFE